MEVSEQPRRQISALNVNVSKQTTLLDGPDVGTPKWRASMVAMWVPCDVARSDVVHEV